tara:strand:- start:444 stop:638 length:195 start_codon:yes stop_codon:yes gene_type:complete
MSQALGLKARLNSIKRLLPRRLMIAIFVSVDERQNAKVEWVPVGPFFVFILGGRYFATRAAQPI